MLLGCGSTHQRVTTTPGTRADRQSVSARSNTGAGLSKRAVVTPSRIGGDAQCNSLLPPLSNRGRASSDCARPRVLDGNTASEWKTKRVWNVALWNRAVWEAAIKSAATAGRGESGLPSQRLAPSPIGGMQRPAVAAPSSIATVMQCIKDHESGNYTESSHPSSGSGAFQYIGPTWRTWSARAGYPGYPLAYMAPPAVQDAVTVYTLTHGGAHNWDSSYGDDPCTEAMP